MVDVADIVNGVARWARLVFVAFACAVDLMRWHEVAHPRWMAAACGLMLAWNTYVACRSVRPGSNKVALAAIDVVLLVALLIISPVVMGPGVVSHNPLIPGFVTVSTVLLVAVWFGFWPGLIAGAALGSCVVAMHLHADTHYVGLALADTVLGAGLGLMTKRVQGVIDDRDAKLEQSAKLAERERLSRIVHDGTLQVLALVEREGRSLGPKGHRLAKLASSQEAKLRTLLQDRTVDLSGTVQQVDVTSMLDQHQSDVVTVSAMAGRVMMRADRARELNLAVAELISNVIKHAGPDARAWLLLEQDGDELIVSFRDDGRGMSDEALEAARQAGRMGISGSVTGRLQALGGSSTVSSREGKGVDWELRLPLEAQLH